MRHSPSGYFPITQMATNATAAYRAKPMAACFR
jgi:hypothetical protein